jgi:hypothetical protein
MKVNLVNLKIILLQFFAVLMVWYLAESIIERSQAGLLGLSLNLGLFYSLFFFIILFLCFFKCNQNSPQYILIGILIFYSYVWFFVFFSVAGYSDTKIVFLGGLLFILPVISLTLTEKYFKINYNFTIFKHGLFKLPVEFVITAILIFSFISMIIKMDFSFSFSDSYERRIMGREIVTGLLGYFLDMSSNSLSPILAFLAIYNRNYKYLFFAFTFAIFTFAFIGSKAPFFYVTLMSFVGYYFSKRSNNVVYFFVLTMTTLIFFAFLESLLFDAYSISDEIVRRVSLLPVLIQMYYLDFMFTQAQSNYSFITGNQDTTRITYRIGEIYFENPLSNANTISFLAEFGQRGILGYFLNILFLVFFFSFLQHLDKVFKHKIWMAIATIYSLLLLEQSYTVAFVSSGIGLITILCLLFNYKKNKYD